MLFRKITAVYYENHNKYITIVWAKNADFLNIKVFGKII